MPYNFHNVAHLGDCVFSMHYLRKLAQVCNEEIHFYTPDPYLGEIRSHVVNDEKIHVHPLPAPADSIPLWIATDNFHIFNSSINLNEFYPQFWEYISQKCLKIPSPAKSLLSDHPLISVYSYVYRPYDFLIVNSVPMSGQFDYNEAHFQRFIYHLRNCGYSIITTKKVPEIPCTLDSGMNLLMIGGLSVKCKNIIGVNTAPMIHTLNQWNIDSSRWYILSNRETFTYNDRIKRYDNLDDVVREFAGV